MKRPLRRRPRIVHALAGSRFVEPSPAGAKVRGSRNRPQLFVGDNPAYCLGLGQLLQRATVSVSTFGAGKEARGVTESGLLVIGRRLARQHKRTSLDVPLTHALDRRASDRGHPLHATHRRSSDLSPTWGFLNCGRLSAAQPVRRPRPTSFRQDALPGLLAYSAQSGACSEFTETKGINSSVAAP